MENMRLVHQDTLKPRQMFAMCGALVILAEKREEPCMAFLAASRQVRRSLSFVLT